ncbi:MAG: hypothetical protein K2N10_05910, partial [Muribaculaceae bacterium]|nr:hypothetical protein [Muribaculaceae bacterium]
ALPLCNLSQKGNIKISKKILVVSEIIRTFAAQKQQLKQPNSTQNGPHISLQTLTGKRFHEKIDLA